MYNNNDICSVLTKKITAMNGHGILKFSDDKKTVISILGETVEIASQKETYDALEKMRQSGQIDLPQLKDAMHEANVNAELPWDNFINHGGVSTTFHHSWTEEDIPTC